ncbi:MAG TPA: protein FdrA [Pseudonocardiaceae bacterium]|jgi:FdrA protein|nr:protein FdrA [Pseudonocardiaceae bacterium]
MSATRVRLFRGAYVDSVVQLSGTRAMRAVDGVEWAAAAMATPVNLATLAEQGFNPQDWSGSGANDLVMAVRASCDEVAEQAEQAGRAAIFDSRSSDSAGGGSKAEQPPRTLREAMDRAPGSNVAVISVPGDYAALEAHHALSAGLDVLLFSDNVSLAAEVQLKQRAQRLGRLVMGPGAGTAMLGGTCLGFANVTTPGPVAVVAAAGTGAQEAMSLLDRWGAGVSHVIGLGGRDLSAGVGGTMARSTLHALAGDERTEVVLLVSKPPAPDIVRAVLPAAGRKPVIAALLGLPGDLDVPDGILPGTRTRVTLATTLEAGVVATLAALGRQAPDPAAGLRERVAGAITPLPPRRRLVRGLFSGGTLCYESLVILAEHLGPVYSNTPLDPDLGLPAPADSHTCLDLGEEEYTKGRPHPMIDPQARIELLREQGTDPDVAVIILDVVLGYGAHEDPAAELAPVCAEIIADGGPLVVVYVLGTHGDPQGFDAQRQAFTEAGCVVTETAARASLAAAAIARRDPALCEVRL